MKRKKSIFVLGDSISIHYGPYLKELIEPGYIYKRKGGKKADVEKYLNDDIVNGRDSNCIREYLVKGKKFYYKHDYMLLNCGLHDIKVDPETGKKQVPESIYRKNLEKSINYIKKLNTKIIWVRTTPIDDKRHNRIQKNFSRFNRDVVRCNKIADSIMKKNRILVLDLYSFTKNIKGNPYQDHVHFNKTVRKLQAKYIAGHLNSI